MYSSSAITFTEVLRRLASKASAAYGFRILRR